MEMIRSEEEKKRVLRIALYAGEIMVRSGAEVYRVEDTIVRICNTLQVRHVSAFVTPTVIILSDERYDGFSFVRNINRRTTDLNKIALINDFSRSFLLEDSNLESALQKLKDIDIGDPYPQWLSLLGAGVASGVFAVLFGGNLSDFFCSFLIAVIATLSYQKIESLVYNPFIGNAVAGSIIGILALFCASTHFNAHLDLVIVGAIMPLLPGVSLTNGLRDFISGDLLSGLSRAVEALLVAVAIATGIGFALSIWVQFGGIIS